MVVRSRSCIRIGVALAVTLMAGALGGAAAPAAFHLHLVKSTPAGNATVDAPPESIRLWFSQQPELAVTSVRVTGPKPKTTSVALAPLARGDSALVVVAAVKGKMTAGSYTVAWRTMAKDGHVARGTFAFTVAGPR